MRSLLLLSFFGISHAFKPADRAALKAAVDACVDGRRYFDGGFIIEVGTKDGSECYACLDGTIKTSAADCGNGEIAQFISVWDTSLVTDMTYLFEWKTKFNQPLYWDTSNVKDFTKVFYRMEFNEDISSWDVSTGTKFISMFAYNSKFNQDISSWDTSSAKNFDYMFYESPFNQDISTWDTSSVTNMQHMFMKSAFDQDISCWDTSSLVSGPNSGMYRMFKESSMSKTLCWTGVNTHEMFTGATGSLDSCTASGCNADGAACSADSDCISGACSTTCQPRCKENEHVSSGACAACAAGKIRPAGDDPAGANTACETPRFKPADTAALQTAIDACVDNTKDGSECYACLDGTMKTSAADCGNGEIAQFISNWDTSLVTDMSSVFMDKTNFNQDISAWDISKVTNVMQMFRDMTFNQDISSWDTSSVTRMSSMFYGNTAFNKDISSWDVSNVIQLNSMFRGSPFDQDISCWDISSVTSFHSMFLESSMSKTLCWDTGSATTTDMFTGSTGSVNSCTAACTADGAACSADSDCISGACSTTCQPRCKENEHVSSGACAACAAGKIRPAGDDPAGTDTACETPRFKPADFNALRTAVNACTDTTTKDGSECYACLDGTMKTSAADCGNGEIAQFITDWDTSLVTTMASLFNGKSKFNQPLNWDTSSVTKLTNTFRYLDDFNQDLNWDTSSVTDMECTFQYAEKMNGKLPWDTSSVVTMAGMFASRTVFNQDISSWDTGQVKNFGSMFYNAYGFDQDISCWDISSVTSFSNMFEDADVFSKTLCWDTSSATSTNRMFNGNQGGGSVDSCTASGCNADGAACSADSDCISGACSTTCQPRCKENEHVSSGACAACAAGKIRPAGDDPAGANTACETPRFKPADRAALKAAVDACVDGDVYINNPIVKDGSECYACLDGTMKTSAETCAAGDTAQFITNWDTSLVTSFESLFRWKRKFNEPLNWDTSSVTNLSNMFNTALEFNQDISSWDVSRVTRFDSMFCKYQEIINEEQKFNQDISSWDTSEAVLIGNMFNRNDNFNQDISSWNTSSVINTYSMFAYSSFDQDISCWDISSVTSFHSMFKDSSMSKTLCWDTTADTTDMFTGSTGSVNSCTAACTADGAACSADSDCISGACSTTCQPRCKENEHVSSGACAACAAGKIRPAGDDPAGANTACETPRFKPANLAALKAAVDACTDTTTKDGSECYACLDGTMKTSAETCAAGDTAVFITDWDTSLVTDMGDLFEDKSKFNQPLNWDTSSVTIFRRTFENTEFNQDISSWDVSKATSFHGMFSKTPFNQDISSWDMSSATTLAYMFYKAPSFNQDISAWDTSSVESMMAMFMESAFDQDISCWDTSSLQSGTNNNGMRHMFQDSSMSKTLCWTGVNEYNMFLNAAGSLDETCTASGCTANGAACSAAAECRSGVCSDSLCAAPAGSAGSAPAAAFTVPDTTCASAPNLCTRKHKQSKATSTVCPNHVCTAAVCCDDIQAQTCQATIDASATFCTRVGRVNNADLSNTCTKYPCKVQECCSVPTRGCKTGSHCNVGTFDIHDESKCFTCDASATCTDKKCVCPAGFGGVKCDVSLNVQAKIVDVRTTFSGNSDSVKVQRQNAYKAFVEDIVRAKVAAGAPLRDTIRGNMLTISKSDLPSTTAAAIKKTPRVAAVPNNADQNDDCHLGASAANCGMVDLKEDRDTNHQTIVRVGDDVGSWSVLVDGGTIVSKQTRTGTDAYDMQCWDTEDGDWQAAEQLTTDDVFACNDRAIYIGSQIGICDETTCHNGGTCTASGNTFTCICPILWSGQICTVPNAAGNDGTSQTCSEAYDDADRIAFQNLNCACGNSCKQ